MRRPSEMNPLKLLVKPLHFFESVEKTSVKTGLIIFSAAALSQIIASLVFLNFKTVYEVALGEYSLVELRLFRLDYIVMSSLTTVFVALVIHVGVGRILGRLTGRNTPPMKTFINAVFHVFIILAAVNISYAALASTAQPETYYVFGFELTDVVFYNVTLTYTNSAGENVSVENSILYAKKANVSRVHSDLKPVKTGAYTAEEVAKILAETRLRAVLLQPSSPPYRLPEKLEAGVFLFNDVDAKNIVLTSVGAVREGSGTFLVQLSLLRNTAWRVLLSVYLGLCVYVLHRTSKKAMFLVMAASYLASTNLVPSLF
ncbi:MAG: hypothetical protein RMH74_02760 [Candidatus Caldarchaeum sp.]|nr:hypothetical protein [Candidatus Caldarchaeum sp.]